MYKANGKNKAISGNQKVMHKLYTLNPAVKVLNISVAAANGYFNILCPYLQENIWEKNCTLIHDAEI